MNWTSDDLRVAALRLLLGGQVRRTGASDLFLRQLDEIDLVTPAPRQKDVFLLAHDGANRLGNYLSTRWPEYAEVAQAFAGQADTITVAQLRALRRVHLKSPEGFARLNRKTWSAWAGAHSKSGEIGQPDNVALTIDDALRFKVNEGLRLRSEDASELDLSAGQRVTGETIFPERAFSAAWTLCGTMPRSIVTVENLGAFVDIPKPPGCLLIHSPGWNTVLATRLVAKLPTCIPWWHFGDMDGNGLKIGLTMQAEGDPLRKPRVWIPQATRELLHSHALPLEAPWRVMDIPPELLSNETLAWLVAQQKWMEHEAVVLLPAFCEELASLQA